MAVQRGNVQCVQGAYGENASLQNFRWFFGQDDDTIKTFRN